MTLVVDVNRCRRGSAGYVADPSANRCTTSRKDQMRRHRNHRRWHATTIGVMAVAFAILGSGCRDDGNDGYGLMPTKRAKRPTWTAPRRLTPPTLGDASDTSDPSDTFRRIRTRPRPCRHRTRPILRTPPTPAASHRTARWHQVARLGRRPPSARKHRRAPSRPPPPSQPPPPCPRPSGRRSTPASRRSATPS